jgi:2-amino-4-hydroxy-6-hydroxymethyldihydropteridine diphosphokinase
MTAREADSDNVPAGRQTGHRVTTVYLGLGTNLGDREANLGEALDRIAALGLRLTRRSSIYETEPVGFIDQGWFLNQVVEAEMPRELTFGLSRRDAGQLKRMFSGAADEASAVQCGWLLRELLNIEAEMGRHREIANGPRPIDIDILLCGQVAGVFCDTCPGALGRLWREHKLPNLRLPHPRMHRRRFVLAPLCEIAPAVIHPTLQKSCAELLAALDDPAAGRAGEGEA